ncbi:MAG TPA: class I SAM-dependent methyltransferase [Dehalococcoidia bacterium]|nr:class I SAM-dependent methyltransferase [Dehalococcoidia bacterium]
MKIEHIDSSIIERKKLVCPWQLAPIIDNRLRPLVHNPQKIFAPYVETGMTVLDVGCGAGFTSLGLAKLVGEEGLVIAADLQPKMLSIVKERAVRAGLSNRIRIHLCSPERIGLQEEVDFAVAFFMVHEVPDVRTFLEEIYELLKNGGQFFVTEPIIHVGLRAFRQLMREARDVGFEITGRPSVRFGRTVLLVKLE